MAPREQSTVEWLACRATKGETQSLGDELYRLIEAEQGAAYISDSMGELPNKTVFAIARGSLSFHQSCVRKLQDWLQSHNEL